MFIHSTAAGVGWTYLALIQFIPKFRKCKLETIVSTFAIVYHVRCLRMLCIDSLG